MRKALISLFDLNGTASQPYKEAGWIVKQIDNESETDPIDIMTWDYVAWYNSLTEYSTSPQVGIIAMIPCTAYALCGNRHKHTPERKIIFEQSQKLIAKTKEIIDFFGYFHLNVLQFWQAENPMSDIHKHNPWMGKVKLQFDPCDYAGYDPEPDKSRYNKRTWLWGDFEPLEKKRIEPFEKDSPIWTKYGGKSKKTKQARSITPLGFAYAFYEANH